jgi:hypothetical protein
MNREEASQALELLKRIVSQARDDTALQNWGTIWILHGMTNAVAFVATNLLLRSGHVTPLPYAVLWTAVLAFNLVTIFLLKSGSSGVRSFVENQIWMIWSTFIVASSLVCTLNYVMGLQTIFAGVVMTILAGSSFASMGAVIGRRWFGWAAAFGAAAVVMAFVPDWQFAILGALSSARTALPREELARVLSRAGVAAADGRSAIAALERRGLVAPRADVVELTSGGIRALLDACAEIEAALDPSPRAHGQEECPSVPWLTTVQTCWIDALSINYAVDADALARLLPAPLEPEVHRGTAWVQLLVSSLRDMRPQGLPSLFGVCFYQVSYRAAVTFTARGGERRRGGYFIRSETNHPVMRAVGNALTEFRFHDFGAAEIVMLRKRDRLVVGVDPEPPFPGGKVAGVFDTRPLEGPPPGSAWRSLDDLREPLVECYDAFGVDAEQGFVYVLTIDRDPWNPRFVRPEQLYAEWADRGPLAGATVRLDSVLHVRECGYRWRPLRRERIAAR